MNWADAAEDAIQRFFDPIDSWFYSHPNLVGLGIFAFVLGLVAGIELWSRWKASRPAEEGTPE